MAEGAVLGLVGRWRLGGWRWWVVVAVVMEVAEVIGEGGGGDGGGGDGGGDGGGEGGGQVEDMEILGHN